MNLIKRLSVVGSVALMVAVTSTGVMAQGPGGGGGRRGGMRVTVAQVPAGYLASQLKLGDDVKAKIADIDKKLADDTKAAQPADPTTLDQQGRQDLRTKVQGLNQTASDQINALLTDDQKVTLRQLLRDLGTLNAAGIPTAALDELKLTDDQKTKLMTLGTDTQAATQKAFQDANGNFQAMGQVIQQLRTDTNTKRDAILTDDQKAVIKKYPQGGFGGFGGGRRQRPAGA